MPGQSDPLLEGDNVGTYTASGSINAKDLVELTSNDNEVQQASSDGADGFGVALYDVSDGDAVAVARGGTKVLVSAASGVSAGDKLTANGATTAGEVATAGTTGDEVIGKADTASSSGEAEAQIYPPGGQLN